VGWIAFFGSKPGPNFAAFLEGLRERGYVEGQNVTIEYRSAEGREDRLSEIAAEMVRLKVDAIVAINNAATHAARKATATIPIIFVYGDPVWDGTVHSLAQPGKNLTGLSILAPQMAGKRLELLKEVFPKITRVGILLDPDAPVHTRQLVELQVVARSLGVRLQALELRDSELDFGSIFRRANNQRANALLTLPNPTVSFHRRRILDLAMTNRLPAIYPDSSFTDAGGLMSYGPDHADLYRRAAFFVDKNLKGAKPAELPVEQPTKFELIINLKAAKQIGVNIPRKVLMWADKVVK
jgi:putative ABC transport system substrate-binding protein